MSEERVIRINKVLRELNISLDRAVDYLKDKGHNIDASPNAKISSEEYNALINQFSADKGKKVASLEVSEEKRKAGLWIILKIRATILTQAQMPRYPVRNIVPLSINFLLTKERKWLLLR